MKKTFFCLLVLLFMANFTQAAFLVKHPAVATAVAAATGNVTEQNATTGHARHNFISRIENRILSTFMPGDEGWGGHRGEGSRAMFWALWGVFIWPLGILAIVHGVRGLSSHNGMEQDRATLGLIFGIGETLLTLACVLWFFAFFFI